MADCLLCGRKVPKGQRRVQDVCDAPLRDGGHRTYTTVVQVATGHNGRPLEVLELTHTLVTGRGDRRWAGTGEDGRRVIWDEIAS